jgi:hypothetical protein
VLVPIASADLSEKSYILLALIVCRDELLIQMEKLRHLRYFTAVAEHLNFLRSAQVMGARGQLLSAPSKLA